MVQTMPGPPSKPTANPAAPRAAKPDGCVPGAQPTTTPPARAPKSTTTVTPSPCSQASPEIPGAAAAGASAAGPTNTLRNPATRSEATAPARRRAA